MEAPVLARRRRRAYQRKWQLVPEVLGCRIKDLGFKGFWVRGTGLGIRG